MARILIADNQMLTRKGIIAFITAKPGMDIIGEAKNNEELESMIKVLKPDVTLLDAEGFELNDFGLTNILVLYNPDAKENVAALIQAGNQNFICKNCSHEEMEKAIILTAKKERFFCTYSKQYFQQQQNSIPSQLALLSDREVEIVNLIATGMTNKEIAGQLFLSIHTVSTHRKNIIKKLGFTFKNAADLVTYLSKL